MWNSGQTAEDEDGEDAAAMTEAQSAESVQSGAAANSYEVRDTDAYYDSDEEPYIPLGAYGYPGLRGSEAVRARARVAIQLMRESGVWDTLPPPGTPPRKAPPPVCPVMVVNGALVDDPVARASIELDARMAVGGPSAASAALHPGAVDEEYERPFGPLAEDDDDEWERMEYVRCNRLPFDYLDGWSSDQLKNLDEHIRDNAGKCARMKAAAMDASLDIAAWAVMGRS